MKIQGVRYKKVNCRIFHPSENVECFWVLGFVLGLGREYVFREMADFMFSE